MLKMEVFLNRSQKTKPGNKVIQLGSFLFDAQNYSLRINEETILLTQRESELLKLFTENKDMVLTREIILKKLWGDDDYFMGRSLDVFISRLRKILSVDKQVQIENLHGIGFRFTIK
jgi:DNA-binding response OmpR family regulator